MFLHQNKLCYLHSLNSIKCLESFLTDLILIEMNLTGFFPDGMMEKFCNIIKNEFKYHKL